MIKKIVVSVTVILVAGFFLVPMVSADCDLTPDQCRSKISQQSQHRHMKVWKKGGWFTTYLYEKDPISWDVIGDGAWAMLKYRPEGTDFKFLLVAKKLMPNTAFTLIYYPDPWPGTGLICLGSGVSDETGKLKIKGKGDPLAEGYSEPVSTGNMPIVTDDNAEFGAKVWLVLSSDVDCANEYMTAWSPAEYLFESTLITFVDTDGE